MVWNGPGGSSSNLSVSRRASLILCGSEIEEKVSDPGFVTIPRYY